MSLIASSMDLRQTDSVPGTNFMLAIERLSWALLYSPDASSFGSLSPV
jgi:hypothetical protein